MARTDYANTNTNVVCSDGGTILAAASTTTQLTSTSTPCRVVRLSTSSSNVVHWAINSVNVSAGAIVPSGTSSMINIDDASKVWCYASTPASVFATYMR